MLHLRVLLLAVLLACAAAFVPPMPFKQRMQTKVMAGAPDNLLKQAEICLNGECEVGDVNDLLIQIRVRIKELQTLEGELTSMASGAAQADDMRDLIKAVLRALNVNPDDDFFPSVVMAGGFSGDKLKGGKDGR